MTQIPHGRKPPDDDDGPSMRSFLIMWAIAFLIVVIVLWVTVTVTAPTGRSI
jgi:hypothetical protein